MVKVEELVKQMEANPKNIRFSALVQVCEYHFGVARQRGSSHCVYKTPWLGDPRVNIQNNKGKAVSGKASFTGNWKTKPG